MRDERGRITEGDKLGQDNPKLFNAAYLLMMKISGKINTGEFDHVVMNDLDETDISVGLWSRHTSGFRAKHHLPHNPISHDECNGIAIVDLLINSTFPCWTMMMLGYLKANDNCYSDAHPNAKPFTEFKKRPIPFLKELYAFHKAIKNNPHDEDGQDAKFSKDVVALRYWRRPRDIGFYKIIVKKRLNPLEWLDFHLAWIFSLFVSYKPGQQNSGTLMTAYKLIALAYEGRSYWPAKIFDHVMTKRLGKQWLYEMCKCYFKNPYYPDLEHIITAEAKKVTSSNFYL